MNFNLQGIDHDHHYLHDQNQIDDDHDEIRGVIISRSYDCVFCQRGFTTAQALGGHMNIHRKDRSLANPKPCISPPNLPTNYKLPTLIRSKQVGLEEDEEDNYGANTRLFYSSPPRNYFGYSNSPGTSSLGGYSSSGKRVQVHDHGQEEEEVDLELRLGNYPW